MQLQTMSRVVVWATPALLVLYAGARWLDGRDGDHGPGVAWDVGHWAFLVAFSLFGFAVVVANAAVVRRDRARWPWATGAVGLVGVGLFLWVILGDLFPGVKDLYDLPDAVMALGPLAFLVGLVSPLLALARDERWTGWIAPAAAVVAFLLLATNLDLLVVAALLFGVALRPLPRAARGLW